MLLALDAVTTGRQGTISRSPYVTHGPKRET